FEIKYAAAGAKGIAVGDSQAGDTDGNTVHDKKNAVGRIGKVAVNGEVGWPGAVDVQAGGDNQLAARQSDRAGYPCGVNGVAVGRAGQRRAQRSRSAIGSVADGNCCRSENDGAG